MAKKKEETGNKLQDALQNLDKKFGIGTVLTLESKSSDNYDLISSGSIAFDYYTLGIGGFAKGKLYELRGWEGSGKSTICGHAVANCQKNGGKVLYIDGEHAVDKNYFKALGVDTKSLMIAQPSNGEEGFQIADELIRTKEFDLVIIDSDSSLIPKAVLDGEVGESAIGKKARLNSSAYPKLKSALSEANTCVIVVSQFREKIGQMFGDPRTTQGGHALKYYADCIIEVTKSLAKEGDETYGNVTKVKAIKNKMSPPYKQSEFEVLYGKGIDRIGELIKLASEFQIIKKWGKTITVEDEKIDESIFKDTLITSSEFFQKIRDSIIDKFKNKPEESETKEETVE